MSIGFQISSAQPADAAGIAHVNYTSWRETYSGILDDAYLDELNLPEYLKKWQHILAHQREGQFAYVAKNEADEVIGYCTGGRVREKFHDFAAEIYAL